MGTKQVIVPLLHAHMPTTEPEPCVPCFRRRMGDDVEDVSHIARVAQEMGLSHPLTFEAPIMDDVDHIKTGWLVKICVPTFTDDETGEEMGGERFWTVVHELRDDDVIIAGVNNQLFNLPWELGDRLLFCKKHVYEVMPPRDGEEEG